MKVEFQTYVEKVGTIYTSHNVKEINNGEYVIDGYKKSYSSYSEAREAVRNDHRLLVEYMRGYSR